MTLEKIWVCAGCENDLSETPWTDGEDIPSLPSCVYVLYLISSMLLQLFVELQGDANHHLGLVPIGVGDVVQDAIEIYKRDKQIKWWLIATD